MSFSDTWQNGLQLRVRQGQAWTEEEHPRTISPINHQETHQANMAAMEIFNQLRIKASMGGGFFTAGVSGIVSA